MTHTLYFDRRLDSIHGVVTLQRKPKDGPVIKYFERLPARSGQRGHTHTSWVQGKSPTPFGSHWLYTKPTKLNMSPRGTPFFHICSDPENVNIIQGPDGKVREVVGLHYENEFPGTEGCTALIRTAQAEALFDYLARLHSTEPFIRYVVL